MNSDVLHPNRANVAKDELRQKLADVYKANKDQVSVFGFRTQYGGGKSTGFALIYDSHEAMKKFEPHYRLVRYGAATKVEKASRQQRTCTTLSYLALREVCFWDLHADVILLQASNARTEPRPFGERRRRKEQERTRRRSKELLAGCGDGDMEATIVYLLYTLM